MLYIPLHEPNCEPAPDLQSICVQGQLAAALEPFDEALSFVSFRTRIGGEVTLQKAICLDSLVRTCR